MDASAFEYYTVAYSGSIARAAGEMGMEPSMLTRHIGRLEEEAAGAHAVRVAPSPIELVHKLLARASSVEWAWRLWPAMNGALPAN